MNKTIKVVRANWMDIVEGKKLDDSNSISLQEAIEELNKTEELEKAEKQKAREDRDKQYLEYQLDQLITAYKAKDWQTCLELIVQRMGGEVSQPEYKQWY